MERHVYTITVNEFDQYKRRLNLPDNVSLTFWFRKYPNKNQESAKEKKE